MPKGKLVKSQYHKRKCESPRARSYKYFVLFIEHTLLQFSRLVSQPQDSLSDSYLQVRKPLSIFRFIVLLMILDSISAVLFVSILFSFLIVSSILTVIIACSASSLRSDCSPIYQLSMVLMKSCRDSSCLLLSLHFSYPLVILINLI